MALATAAAIASSEYGDHGRAVTMPWQINQMNTASAAPTRAASGRKNSLCKPQPCNTQQVDRAVSRSWPAMVSTGSDGNGVE